MAKEAPTVDFQYFPGQDYPGKPWSNWGNSTFAHGKYYASIGDHLAPQGNAFVFEYDPMTKQFRRLLDVRQLLDLPEGHYTPGKIHSRLDMGRDGWLYCSTHRGSTRVTTDENHYRGDWIVRIHPETSRGEIVVQGPVPKHCIPTGLLDPKRMIFYASTAPGQGGDNEEIQFFAYDVEHHKMLYAGPNGPSRCLILAVSTGRVYYVPGQGSSPLMRFDPRQDQSPAKIEGEISIRAATEETPDGAVYVASFARGGESAQLYRFNTQSERIEPLGPASVATQQYITALAADPQGRFVYYVPGAHGGAHNDGTPIVQFDTRTATRKVVAFLNPWFEKRYGCSLGGTYSVAIDDSGSTLYITWNVSRGSRAWDCCALTAIHIPPSER